MRIKSETIGRYHSQIKQLSEQAAKRYEAIINGIKDAWSSTEQEALVEQLTQLADDILASYGDAAATVSANLYAEIAEMSGILHGGLQIADPMAHDRIKRRIDKLMGQYQDGEFFDYEGFLEALKSMIRSAVRGQAGRTILDQVERDSDRYKVRYARVPMGNETCAWCIMLASQGYVYKSEKSALYRKGKSGFRSAAEHFHDNCDCIVVPVFGDGSIEGYDPDEYLAIYQKYQSTGPGNNTVATLNNMRRGLYADYKDRRNLLRRQNYARKKQAREQSSD